MADDVAKELAVFLSYAQAVSRALPIDEEADRAAELALAKHSSALTRRKITKKARRG